MRLDALKNGINLIVKGSLKTYRTYEEQEKIFLSRFTKEQIAGAKTEIYQNEKYYLKRGAMYAAPPNKSLHCYGLAVDIFNIKQDGVLQYLLDNASKFGFAWQYDFEEWHIHYYKSE